jgi:uncharacterized membrane protein YiaA
MASPTLRPSLPFLWASWIAFLTGSVAFGIGLTNAKMMLNEQGYYLTVLLFGLFATVSIAKTLRDRDEGIPVTPLYLGLCWVALGSAVTLLVVGLVNASSLALSEKGFYGMAFVLSLFGAISVQKTTRDLAAYAASAPTQDRFEGDV